MSELLELNLSSLLHTLNDGNDVLLKADSNWPEILTQLKQQLSSLQADNERLRKALQKIDSATYAHKEWTDMHKVNHIATEALQNK